jgi:hypothetical protein
MRDVAGRRRPEKPGLTTPRRRRSISRWEPEDDPLRATIRTRSPKEPVAPIWPFSLVHFLLLSVSASFELQTNTDRLEFRTRLQGSGLWLCKVVVRRAGSQTELTPLPSAPKRWAENTREPSGTAGRLATRSLAPAPGSRFICRAMKLIEFTTLPRAS